MDSHHIAFNGHGYEASEDCSDSAMTTAKLLEYYSYQGITKIILTTVYFLLLRL